MAKLGLKIFKEDITNEEKDLGVTIDTKSIVAETDSPPAPQVSRKERLALIENIQQQLYNDFPNAFNDMRKPLKVGIHEDLIPWCEKKGISAQHLSIFMRRWCSNIKYLRKLGKKSHRRNLDGEKIEEITIEHKQDAQNKLANIMSKMEAKKRANTGENKENGTTSSN